ncbi:hypothetical protein INT45_006980 [Circinella minor]|uniref:C5a peptidase/Subtilisin-like protease SBT2-like Fn3-like domain-containing protein n=1 Tax=Circinella minor TaxID=1195481 RepID=A0A8H7S650_9FUNG|nr:hypothetical protein INT45_006980 [Circinella minor]
MAAIYDAIHTTVQIEPYKIALNDTAHFQRNITLTIRNLSPNTDTFQLSHLPATSIEGFNLHPSAVPVTAPNYKNTHASVTFDQTKFIIEGNKKISVNVYFDPPQENITEHMLYGGYIELSSNNSASSSRVPYFGSLGNQYDLPIFDVSNEFPFIGDYYGSTTMQSRIYNFKRRDSLFLYVRIANPTRIFKAELLDAASNVSVGSLPGIHGVWLPRNDHTKENHKYVYEWRGGIHASSSPRRQASYRSVSRGRYRIRLSALRIFGDHNIKKDWHVWESPEFSVQ